MRSSVPHAMPLANGFSRRTLKPSANPAGLASSAAICAWCVSIGSSAPASNHCNPGNDALWIIDYKTSHNEGIDPSSALPVFRATFAPQLQMYAAVLRNLHCDQTLQLRAGLYYPRMSLFDWWEI